MIICYGTSSSVELARHTGSHQLALPFPAVKRPSFAAGTFRFLRLLLLRGRSRALLVDDQLSNALFDLVYLLLHDLLLFTLLFHLFFSLALFKQTLPVPCLLLLQQGFVDISQSLRFVSEVCLFIGDRLVFLDRVDIVDENNLIETVLFLSKQLVPQRVHCGPKTFGLFLLLKLSGLKVLAIFFARQLVPLQKLVVHVLQEIDPIVDDILIAGKPLLELLVSAAKIKVLPVPCKTERLAFVPHQLDVILEESRPLPEIVASFFLGVE